MLELPLFPLATPGADLPACSAVQVQAFFADLALGERRLARLPRWHRRGGKTRYLIGPRAGADAPGGGDGLDDDNHALVEAGDRGFVIRPAPGMTGELSLSGQAMDWSEWMDLCGPSFPCSPGLRLRLRQGAMTFVINDDAEPPAAGRLAPTWSSGWRWSEQKYTAATGLMLGLMLLAAWLLPPDPRALVLSRWGQHVRFLELRLIPPEPLRTCPAAGSAAPASGAPAGER